MNSVLPGKKKTQRRAFIIDELTGDKFDDKRTAFIGIVDGSLGDVLYLVTYGNVVLASNPRRTWTHYSTVDVKEFVNVEIRAV